MQRVLVALSFAALGVAPLTSQSPPGGPARFEVVSVKRNTSGRGSWSLNPLPGGRFSAQNVPLRDVVLFTYNLRGFQLANDPAWLQSLRFDIDARAAADVPLLSIKELVKSLLAERFGFAAHLETRQLPIYALVALRADRSPGPALKARDCTAPQEAVRAVGAGCGGVIRDTGRITGSGVPLVMLANSLSAVLNNIVSDKTSLSGAFDFELRWSDAVDTTNQPASLSDAPALTTAVQEQLGLRLQPDRGPVQVLVVDHVSEPSEN